MLGHIVLEDRGGLGVVPVEAIENGVDMGRPGFTLIKGNHLGGDIVRVGDDAGLALFLEVVLFGGIFDCGP